MPCLKYKYRIPAYSFHGIYPFFKVENLEIIIQFQHYGNLLTL